MFCTVYYSLLFTKVRVRPRTFVGSETDRIFDLNSKRQRKPNKFIPDYFESIGMNEIGG